MKSQGNVKEKSCNRILIERGKVVNADETRETNILIENGKVKKIGKDITVPNGTKVISADNMFVIPGGIDPHTHLSYEHNGCKTVDDFFKGTYAAVAGGTTTIIDVAISKPGQSLIEVYANYRSIADEKVCCDYSLHIGITWWSCQVGKEMEVLCFHHGINSFKIFLAPKDYLLDDGELYEVLLTCKNLGALCLVHAENGTVIEKNIDRLRDSGILGPEGHALSRPPEVEAEAVNRIAMIARQVGAPIYITNIMTKDAADIVAKRRSEGQCDLYSETLACTLALTTVQTNDFSKTARYIASPPIPSNPQHSEAIKKYLQTNDIQVISSNHCSFTLSQKEVGKGDFTKIPQGVNGIEERMSIIWEKCVHSGQINVEKFVALTSTNAAKLFNIYPKKGYIGIDSDADIVIWNPKKTMTISSRKHHHGSDYNIFEGMMVHGAPELVMMRGQVCYQDHKIKNVKGFGKFLQRPVCSSYVFSSSLTPSHEINVNYFEDNKEQSIAILQNLNFQERQLALSAIKKCAPILYPGSLKLFKKMDEESTGRLKRMDFFKILESVGALTTLSTREVEAVLKGFGHSLDNNSQIHYSEFMKACNSARTNTLS